MKHSTIFLFTLIIFVGLSIINQKASPSPVETVQVSATPTAQVLADVTAIPLASLPPATKTTNCVSVQGLPDTACTPGVADPTVTQDNLKATICASGYSKKVRPPASYTDKLKKSQMVAYGFTDSAKHYEEDHLISLEVGGSPTDPANLWPEPASPAPGFHEKDKVEDYLHTQICKGLLPLRQAQEEEATDWVAIYNLLPNK